MRYRFTPGADTLDILDDDDRVVRQYPARLSRWDDDTLDGHPWRERSVRLTGLDANVAVMWGTLSASSNEIPPPDHRHTDLPTDVQVGVWHDDDKGTDVYEHVTPDEFADIITDVSSPG